MSELRRSAERADRRLAMSPFGVSWWTLIIWIVGVVVGARLYTSLWITDENGLSIVSRTTPYWDFNNLWAGSRMAITGKIDLLFDIPAYRAEMSSLFDRDLTFQEWSYPPSMLLLGAPLALLPPLAAYVLWTVGGVAALHLAVSPLRLPMPYHVAAVISPPILLSALFGQNGALITSLWIGGLGALPTRPLLAGALLGATTIKPNLAILVPIVLAVTRSWRALSVAIATAAALVIGSGVAFGFDAWSRFVGETSPMMRDILEAPFLQDHQTNAVTLFYIGRWLGMDVWAAYAVQAVTSLSAVAATIWVWRGSAPLEHRERIALTGALVLLTTPYGYTYDMGLIAAAIVIVLALRQRSAATPVFAVIWLFPLFNHVIAERLGATVGGLVLLATFAGLVATTTRTGSDPGGTARTA
ncbi:MAG TPA: glycosyltransferase family 87 protein [Acidimicrobiia bacterium]|nr:glycosyltransferase family 87 protein [Acidimicrobiia bacterium]